ncbi:hypothetical protein [Microbacterium sp. NPDC090003]|uniref:hypothetical protein n=1 Tax=Microbacterium sp. NPDC090003 TaxID=3364203 RepID=UPI00380C2C81
MQDLLGRLTALDPDASETLKVVSYFDALVARSVGVESMLRGAAVLSGATVGHRDSRRCVRVRADGVRIEPVEPSDAWNLRESAPDAVVWIERDGAAHANDGMILERLALALGIIRARRAGGAESAVELVISAFSAAEERAAAAARLRLPAGRLRVVASPPDPAPAEEHPSAVVATRQGLVRATLIGADERAEDAWAETGGVRLGVGGAALTEHLADSWESALIAARLTTPSEPVLVADDLGALLFIAQTAGGAQHPDAVALASLDNRSRELLNAVVDGQSVRAAAVRLGRHHSSVQERLASLVEVLGYDPRTPLGQARFVAARLLLRLRD